MNNNIILASSSPRRKEILEKLNIPFAIIPADIDESTRSNETPFQYVERLAIEKAQKVSTTYPESFVIGSDLTCDIDGRAIGKATNRDEAKLFLTDFSGKTHFGRCGYAITKGSLILASGVATSIVTFKQIDSQQLEDYLDSNQWQGLGGAYGIQNDGKNLLQGFQGSYYDILGLPIYHIIETLITFGFSISPETINSIREEDLKFLSTLPI
jgi:septum formation protein